MKNSLQTMAAIFACSLSMLASCGSDGPDSAGGAGHGPSGQGGAGGGAAGGTGDPAALDVTGRYTSSEFEDPFEALLTQAADGALTGTVCGPPDRPDGANTNCGTVTEGRVSGDTVQFSYRVPWALLGTPIDYDFEGTASQDGSAIRFEGQLRNSDTAGPHDIVWTACPGAGRCP